MKPYRGPPATLGSTAAAQARIVGADTPIPEWHRRLVCSGCGGREVDFVLTGARG